MDGRQGHPVSEISPPVRVAKSLKPDRREDPSNRAMDTPPAAVPTVEPAEEGVLIARARARDTAAFRILVERHRDRAYGLALRILRSPADAEEVAQDGFVRAWLALPRFRGESSFATWLHRIVARRAFDRAAALRRRRTTETPLDEAGEVAAGGGAPGDAASRAMRLERMVGTLSEPQRAVLTLFYYEGRSVEQVAAALAIPSGTVKTHLSRARAALRRGWTATERAEAR
jgi:RNA polymerase sigma-70 factor (ECF subfamily)